MNADPAALSSGGRILVIDDDPFFLELLVVILSFDNHVQSALTARAGLELIRCQQFDLVCSDYDLPDVNGLEVLREVGEVAPCTGQLLVTGTDACLRGRAAGAAYDVLLKPFPPQRLLSLTARLVGDARRKRDAMAAAPADPMKT